MSTSLGEMRAAHLAVQVQELATATNGCQPLGYSFGGFDLFKGNVVGYVSPYRDVLQIVGTDRTVGQGHVLVEASFHAGSSSVTGGSRCLEISILQYIRLRH